MARRSSQLAFTVTENSHGIMGRGVAVPAGRPLDAPELVDRLAAAAASGSFTPAGWDGYIYRAEPDRLFAG